MGWLPYFIARIRVSVRLKLLGAFLMVVCLLLTVGSLGLKTLDESNKRSQNLADFERKIAAYRQLQHDTTWQLYSVTEALLWQDPRLLESVLRQLDQYRYDLDRVQFVSKGEKELFDKTSASHDKLVSIVTEMATLSEVDRDSEIMNSKLSQAGAIGENLERLTNEMINRAEADMVDLIHSGQQAYQVSRSTFIGVALVGVAIAVILGYAISAAIIRPVRRMDDQLNKTASGDFSYRVDIPNRDEMGTLATNLNGMNEKLGHLYEALESRNQYIRETFGRYLTDEVVDDILETPDGLRRGGENKRVSIMITDLRGFTALTERLGAEEVVTLLNIYLESMIDIIQHYRGTVNEIFGDSLVVLFGAPQEIPDRISSAVACAIAMQNAMPEVNRLNFEQGLPELQMGIGINDSEVIVGNVGSKRRLKYSVVGSGVNTASRIESYTVGGQILVSESIRKALGDDLLVDDMKEIRAKGSEIPVRIYGVAGLGATHDLTLESPEPVPTELASPIPLSISVIEGKVVGHETLRASLLGFSLREIEIRTTEALQVFANVRINLEDVYNELAVKDCYAKVVTSLDDERYRLRMTSASPEVIAFLEAHRLMALGKTPRGRLSE